VNQYQETLTVATSGRDFVDISAEVQKLVQKSGIGVGLCVIFVRHTSASLVIQENADPAVLRDLGKWMQEIAPESRHWEHADEGLDDMPAHVRSAITKTSESIPIANGRLVLGTWQGIYLWEHRHSPHRRQIVVHIMGEARA
jgi:secondary thiamine-phosphate synthase enzyme